MLQEVHTIKSAEKFLSDPLLWAKLYWPDMVTYPKQAEIAYSVRDNMETFVPAANKMGKTRIAALIALWFFSTRQPARVVCTSSSEGQLKEVLWSEISSLIHKAKYPLPFSKTHLHLTLNDEETGDTLAGHYLIGRVTNSVERFSGHHLPFNKIPRVLFIFEEASGIGDEFYETAQSQAHRILAIGNPLNTLNFFYHKCKGGDAAASSDNAILDRKVIPISAADSPNVMLGTRLTKECPGVHVPACMPGILTWQEFQYRLANWDPDAIRTRVWGKFLDAGRSLLFPAERLHHASNLWPSFVGRARGPFYMGVDVAAGGRDKSVWAIIDRFGVREMVVKDTPNTMEIAGITLKLMEAYGMVGKRVCIDAGGGGKQIADRLREQGRLVQSVHFGSSAEDNKTYKNKRAEMFGYLASLLNADYWNFDKKKIEIAEGEWEELDEYENHAKCFILPPTDAKLKEELGCLPKLWDSEGKMFLPPKERQNNSVAKTLREILGRSPDRADALALAAEAQRCSRSTVTTQADPSRWDQGKFVVDMSWSEQFGR